MKKLSILFILLIACSSGGGGDGGGIAPAPEITGWDLRTVDDSCIDATGQQIVNCYNAGKETNLNNASGTAVYIIFLVHENPNRDAVSVGLRASQGGSVVLEGTILLPPPPPDQQQLDPGEVFATFWVQGAPCGVYQLDVWVSFATGGSTPNFRLPDFNVTTECVVVQGLTMHPSNLGGWYLGEGAF